jgi:hypothetical protein
MIPLYLVTANQKYNWSKTKSSGQYLTEDHLRTRVTVCKNGPHCSVLDRSHSVSRDMSKQDTECCNQNEAREHEERMQHEFARRIIDRSIGAELDAPYLLSTAFLHIKASSTGR